MAKDGNIEATATDGMTTFESRLLNLLALHLIMERPQSEQIDLLNRAGLRAKELALLLRTTDNTVNVRLSNLRKSNRKH
jgi:hypothetical protein